MIRFMLQYLLPLALPTLVFIGWIVLTRQRPGDNRTVAERLQAGPWTLLILGGLMLAVAGLFYLALTDGTRPVSLLDMAPVGPAPLPAAALT